MEKEAEVRNKLQAIRTVLEMLLKGEKPPKKIVNMAHKDLAKLLRILKRGIH